jgi:hypothetical protein
MSSRATKKRRPKANIAKQRQPQPASHRKSPATFAEVCASGRLDVHGVETFQRGDAMGQSVRTLRPFKIDEIVCSYGGKLLPYSKKEAGLSAYMLQWDKDTTIDGHPDFAESAGHVGAFINDAGGPIRDNRAKNNVYFSKGSVVTARRGRVPAMWIKAKHYLPANTELFIAYGHSYWK